MTVGGVSRSSSAMPLLARSASRSINDIRRGSSAHLDAAGPQGVLDRADAQVAEVEDAGREHGVGPSSHGRQEVFDGARSPAGDHRYVHGGADLLDQRQVEAVP